jgi:hypothetical protein
VQTKWSATYGKVGPCLVISCLAWEDDAHDRRDSARTCQQVTEAGYFPLPAQRMPQVYLESGRQRPCTLRPCGIPQRGGTGCQADHHLRSVVESDPMNVGGVRRDVKMSRPSTPSRVIPAYRTCRRRHISRWGDVPSTEPRRAWYKAKGARELTFRGATTFKAGEVPPFRDTLRRTTATLMTSQVQQAWGRKLTPGKPVARKLARRVWRRGWWRRPARAPRPAPILQLRYDLIRSILLSEKTLFHCCVRSPRRVSLRTHFPQ